MGAGPRRDVGSGKRGAGVEERSMQETAGKRSGYGDLSAAAGLFWSRSCRWTGCVQSWRWSTKRCFAPHPASGSASIVVARVLGRASALTVVDHRGKTAKRSIVLIVIMMCRTIEVAVRATMFSAWRHARKPRRESWGHHNRDKGLVAPPQLCLAPAPEAPCRQATCAP